MRFHLIAATTGTVSFFSPSRRQNRYKSIICQEDVYFKELLRYIHLNPVRAKMVPDLGGLNKHPYCGHSALLGKQKGGKAGHGYIRR